MSDPIIWTCSHGQDFTEFELDMGMSLATMDWIARRDELAYNLAHDLATEDSLARAHAYGELECPWPWYADAPIEIAEQEVVAL